MVDGNIPEFVAAVDMGRAAAKFEGFEERLAAMSRAISSLHATSPSYDSPCRTVDTVHQGGDLERIVRYGHVVGPLHMPSNPM